MDKEFWALLMQNDFEIPQDRTLQDLTREIFSHLGSTDPELRDDIGYIVYANWLKQERYSAEDIRRHARELLANLEKGIGETENDSVFLRSFSALLLAEIAHNDNKREFFEKSEALILFEKGAAYLTAEKDLRGYIPEKGWAHALAHTADLMRVLGRNRHIGAKELSGILKVISEKTFQSVDHAYAHGEDERLAAAVVQVLRRDLLPTEEIRHWAVSFVGAGWQGAYADEKQNCAFQNTRHLLKSVYLELRNDEGKMPRKDEYEAIVLEALKNLKPF